MSALIIAGQWLLGAGVLIGGAAALALVMWLLVNEDGQRLLGEVAGTMALGAFVLGFPVVMTYGLWWFGRAVWQALGPLV